MTERDKSRYTKRSVIMNERSVNVKIDICDVTAVVLLTGTACMAVRAGGDGTRAACACCASAVTVNTQLKPGTDKS
ncbi:hypothetical protein EVAR_52183_1 [Eumeta japonica]|uniref:Uncharacterized protein n=1 Tax=Eumeta variegata TaxID=151549 RepID=A0A4C1YCK8_EUMVA|nr:hypothetical protein EVAR_52183_1 [Eumeta japonica]